MSVKMIENPFFLQDSFANPNEEERLILSCSKTWATKEEIEQHIHNDLRWDYVFDSAINHRVANILYTNLQKVDVELVPPDFMKMLKSSYIDTLANNILVVKELKEVLSSLADLNVDVIILKGLTLAETVYPDIALRPFSDVDILIHEKDIKRAQKKLAELSYEPLFGYTPEFTEQFYYEIAYANKSGFLLDLHWNLFRLPYSRYIDMDSFWENSRRLSLDDMEFSIFAPEDLLIYLCLHFSKHFANEIFRLIWLVDISEIIHRYNTTLDWEYITEKALQYKVRSSIRYALNITRDFFDVYIPSSVFERLNESKSKSLRSFLFDILENPNVNSLKWSISDLIAVRGIMPKCRYLYGRILPGKDFLLKSGLKRNRSHFSRICYAIRQTTRLFSQASSKDYH